MTNGGSAVGNTALSIETREAGERELVGVVGDAFRPEPNRFALVPELRLFVAILEDAHFCLTKWDRVHPRTHADAVAWVFGEGASAPYCSFGEICVLLGLDPSAVRAQFLRDAGRVLKMDRDRSGELLHLGIG